MKYNIVGNCIGFYFFWIIQFVHYFLNNFFLRDRRICAHVRQLHTFENVIFLCYIKIPSSQNSIHERTNTSAGVRIIFKAFRGKDVQNKCMVFFFCKTNERWLKNRTEYETFKIYSSESLEKCYGGSLNGRKTCFRRPSQDNMFIKLMTRPTGNIRRGMGFIDL